MKSVRKTLRVPNDLYVHSSKMARAMGVSYQNYVIYLLAEDVRRIGSGSIQNKREDKEDYFAKRFIEDIRTAELRDSINKYANTLDYNS